MQFQENTRQYRLLLVIILFVCFQRRSFTNMRRRCSMVRFFGGFVSNEFYTLRMKSCETLRYFFVSDKWSIHFISGVLAERC